MFETLDHTHWDLGLAMVHYDNVARTLLERPGRYGSLSLPIAPMRHRLGALDRGVRAGRRVYAWQAGKQSSTPTSKRVGDEPNADAC